MCGGGVTSRVVGRRYDVVLSVVTLVYGIDICVRESTAITCHCEYVYCFMSSLDIIVYTKRIFVTIMGVIRSYYLRWWDKLRIYQTLYTLMSQRPS